MRRSGRNAGALDAFRRLASFGDALVANVPARLLAADLACEPPGLPRPDAEATDATIGVFRDLLSGRWCLDRNRHRFYAERLRACLENSGLTEEELLRLAAPFRQRLLLADAVSDAIEHAESARGAGEADGADIFQMSGKVYVGVWRAVPETPATVLLLFPFDDSASLLVAGLVSSASAEKAVVSVVDPSDRVVLTVGGNGNAATNGGLVASQSIKFAGDGWSVRAYVRDPTAFTQSLRRRRYLAVGTVIVMLGSLGIGAYATRRALRKELMVAHMQARMVSAVSHEFRSPVTGIRQLAELLASKRVGTPGQQEQYHRVILHEAERLSRVVGNVLDAARIDESLPLSKQDRIDTKAWLTGAVSDFQRRASTSDVDFVVEVNEQVPALVGDADALTTALDNLLDNAVKYSPDCRKVWVSATSARSEVLIRVRDRGIGMDDSQRLKVFERFYRGEQSATTVRGVGLGLSIVADLVKAHGGKVEVESQPYLGSTFTMRLPAAEDTA